jgi:hypothetical protein
MKTMKLHEECIGQEPQTAEGGAQPCGPLRPSWPFMFIMLKSN